MARLLAARTTPDNVVAIGTTVVIFACMRRSNRNSPWFRERAYRAPVQFKPRRRRLKFWIVLVLGCAAAVFFADKENIQSGKLGLCDVFPLLCDMDCSDFNNQLDAQVMYRKYSYDPFRLDADGDGVACEALLTPIRN